MTNLQKIAAAAALLLSAAAPAGAAETITYSYDARGRLVQVARTGTVNNGVTTSHQYDKADNRVLTSTNGAGSYMAVIPAGAGYRVIQCGGAS